MFLLDDEAIIITKLKRSQMPTSTHGLRDDDAPVKADVAVIGNNTPVKLNLILSIFIPCAAAAGFWAATVSINLKTLVAGQAELKQNMNGYDSRLVIVEKAISDFKLTGSPQVQSLDRRVSILEHDLELHKINDEKLKNK